MRKAKYSQVYFPILFVVLGFLFAGCRDGNPPGSDLITPPERMTAKTQCAADVASTCELVVEIWSAQDDLILDIIAHGDFGVRFFNQDETGTLNQNDGFIQTVALRAQEMRQIHFPFSPVDVIVPGEYHINVTAFHANDLRVPENLRNRPYASVVVPSYIVKTELGDFRLVANKEAFDQRYTVDFVPGIMDVDYRIHLPEEHGGQCGWLYVKIKGKRDELGVQNSYQPSFQVNTLDGVDFDWGNTNALVVSADRKTAVYKLPLMGNEECRILAIPFVVDLDGRQLDGLYSFIATLSYTTTLGPQSKSERLPVGIQVSSDPATHNLRIMAVQGIANGLITPTPVSQAVSLPTAVPTFTPGVGMGAVQPGITVSSSVGVDCQTVATGASDNSRHTFSWEAQKIGLSGSLCQYYLTQVHNRLPISWEQFRGEALLYNPQLVVDGEVFYPEKWYQLPEIEE